MQNFTDFHRSDLLHLMHVDYQVERREGEFQDENVIEPN
jgi:hypothetical protein